MEGWRESLTFFLQLSGVSVVEEGPSGRTLWLLVTPGWRVLSHITWEGVELQL